MVPEGENMCHATVGDSHMGNIRVLPIVPLDRQEIYVHRFHIATAGFSYHRLQGREAPSVAFKREQLSAATIE